MAIIIRGGTSTNTAAVNADGSIKTASQLTTPTGVAAVYRPDGWLRAALDPTSLFFDNFETFNTVDLWSTVGTAPAATLGQLSPAAGTAAGAASIARTLPVFPSFSNSYLQAGAVLALDAAAVVGNKRFWGLGVPAGAPSAAVPLTSGVVFEINDTDGALYGAVYAAGARVKSIPLVRPSDAAMHRYVLYYRTSKVYFEIDGVAVGSIDNPNPSVSAMPFVFGGVNAAAALAAAATMNVTVVGIADTSRNNVQLSDATMPFRKAQIGRNGALSVKGAASTATTATVPAGATGVFGPIDVSEAGNVSFTVRNPTGSVWTGTPVITFERSDDQVNWAPLLCVRADTSQSLSTHTLPAGAGGVSVVFDAAVEGASYARARITTPTTTGALAVSAQPGGWPFTHGVVVQQPARLAVTVSGTSLPVGTTGVETLLNLSQQKGLAAPNVSTSFTVPAGKRFRLQALVLTQVGNASTATAATSIFRLRYNPAGPITTTSTPIMLQTRLAAPATALSFQQISLPIPDGFDVPGDGIGQFGVTVASTYTTNPPTVDAFITGYEY